MTCFRLLNLSEKFKTARDEHPTSNRAYPNKGTMYEMRYANTKILIVTCYLLLPPFYLPCYSHFPPILRNGLETD